ncbi:LysR family transcriptional regulator [Dyella sp. C11]|uniref:LysR family transcriptional regulator n=1 Tax=Dyella sp. C11 TaxID=2126991 RepID=UPI000D64BF5D|nr:LysR family transcriptional regulator [Dyella sp. C11]
MAFDERMLNGMSVFTAVVDAGSFAAAGDALDMSPPGVSRAISRLEARLGIRLFDRTTRSVRLTDEGRRFHLQVLPLLAGLEEAAAGAAQGAISVRGRLRVHMDPLFSRLVLAPRIGEFMAAWPQLEVELATRDQLGDLVADGFDLAVRFGEPPDSSLVARKLLDTRILTVASPAYLRRHGRPANPQELEGDQHICIEFRDPATGRTFPWEFHRKRKRLSVKTSGRLVVNDGGTMHHACLAGYGVAQVMEVATAPFVANGQLLEVFPDWPDERFPLYALYPSRHHPSAKVRAFLDFVIDITSAANR